jgi:hypothetical protein
MPSPFPGMDPYLEEPSMWPEVHGGLIYRTHAALNAILPARYSARVDRYVWLEDAAGQRTRDGEPDVFLTDSGTPSSGGTAVLTAPMVVILPAIRRQGPRYVRIVDRQRRRVVTIIELLSPSNKDEGPDRDAYLAKRNEYLATGTNLVEIDLLRAGERLPLGRSAPSVTGYYILNSPAVHFPQAGLWQFGVRDAIPVIQVPLDPADNPVPLDLKPCLNQVYDEGRYASEIDYSVPPVPPLTEPDATWARDLLARTIPPGATS